VQRLLICGLIRNLENTIVRDVERIRSAFSHFDNIEFCLIESDSADLTVNKVKELQRRFDRINLISLGNLRELYPDRVERIRRCRNEYVEFIRKNSNRFDYVVVADMDGINSKISQAGVKSCFSSEVNWDMCAANQKYGYYDIYALRAPDWCEKDFQREMVELSFGMNDKDLFNLRTKLVYDRMRIIKSTAAWIPVHSAFGGLAIYKSKAFLEADYSCESSLNQCEHVDFHAKLVRLGYNLYINPMLINSNWNTYNINRLCVVRRARSLIRKLPSFN